MLSVQLIPRDKVHGFIPVVIEKRSVKRNALMRQTEFQETKKDPDIDMVVYDKSILRHDADFLIAPVAIDIQTISFPYHFPGLTVAGAWRETDDLAHSFQQRSLPYFVHLFSFCFEHVFFGITVFHSGTDTVGADWERRLAASQLTTKIIF